MSLKQHIYTTAPSDYDYGSTEVVNPNVGRITGHGLADGTVRLVNCNEVQRNRYRSGGYLVTDSLEFAKHFMEESKLTDRDIEEAR